MIPKQILRAVTPLKSAINRNKFTSVIIVTLFVYFTMFYSSSQRVVYDLSDGKSSKGFGILKGGTGNLCYDKDHRIGGLPKVTRFRDPSIFEEFEKDDMREISGFSEAEDSKLFDKERNKIVIILGANIEGGVNRWKGPNEWSIERSSVINKKLYSQLQGYDLVIKDYTKAKKYSNEFREGWQKFDLIKEVMDEYNYGDWFWYVDLYTLIMEPEYKLEDLIFEHINSNLLSRTIEYFNPNGLEADLPMVDYSQPLNLLISQDCGGFNLNSFLIRKTEWSMVLLDVLFDPVVYSVEHPNWIHGEKNALEYYYNKYAWIRSRVGFIPTRAMSSLAPGACPDYEFENSFFYNETSRDFLVNFMGCEFNGRNCWDEMEQFKKISTNLHKNWFQKMF